MAYVFIEYINIYTFIWILERGRLYGRIKTTSLRKLNLTDTKQALFKKIILLSAWCIESCFKNNLFPIDHVTELSKTATFSM